MLSTGLHFASESTARYGYGKRSLPPARCDEPRLGGPSGAGRAPDLAWSRKKRPRRVSPGKGRHRNHPRCARDAGAA
jgi:hypothetical protein